MLIQRLGGPDECFIWYDAHNKQGNKRYHNKDQDDLSVFVIVITVILVIGFLIIHNLLRGAVRNCETAAIFTAYLQQSAYVGLTAIVYYMC